MPSSVSGEPNTTPFSAEQKMRCSSSTEHSSHRLVPTEQDLSMQRPLPQNTKGEGHKDPPQVLFHKHSQLSHFISPCCTYKSFIILLLTSA